MRKYILVIMIMTMVGFIGCTEREQGMKSSLKTDYMMGTIVKMKVYASQPEKIIKKSFKIMDNLEQKMSLNIKGSEVKEINKLAGQKAVKISDATYQVIKKGLEYAKLSQGAFDPTIGPLVELWGIGTKEAQIPTQKEIANKLKLVDYSKLKLVPQKKKVLLTKDNMKLNLGANAKGYAADKVVQFWKAKGVKSGFISLGGNVSVLGTKPDGSLWKVGIQDPKEPRGNVMAIVEVKGKTVVTSGNYERYFMKDGVRYHHILNPKTGRPTRKRIISATIVTDNLSSLDADTLSTTVYVLGVKKGLELINKLPGVGALVITRNNKVYMTANLKDEVKIIKKDKYKVVKNN
ncbi:membrane-associated lipoprotein involved in thiamine biosynthesis [Halobacteroides halobius DSM 5150]|uniref:FAD:protein FMN transferase n=1 Tax=Halobacteroides halobius (strain ATCC 35273 / DSM 5150 / MD-1) TaxID=748449 RepID=L0KBI6_HALHC|nr:FAD:protein FMN transferase [Halobacteroides halobius]AGB41900.1 membrane-associated lipoprotein involved in thiamine biosynthesis [Halobacteroides halobius DSM 5150]